MKKLVALVSTAFFAFSFLAPSASASQRDPERAPIISSQASPTGDAFDAVLYRSKSGQHAVLRLKFPQLNDKIQLVRIDSKGKQRQVFSFTLGPSDLDTEGNYVDLEDGQLLKIFSLSGEKTTFQILVNGKEYLERKTIVRTSKPLVKLNSVNIDAPDSVITGTGDFITEVADLLEGSDLRSLCYFVDGAPASSQQITGLRLGNDSAILDSQGCLAPTSGLPATVPVYASLNTKSLSDGKHTLLVRAGLISAAGDPVSSESSVPFVTDNQSLNATAPMPTLQGSFTVGQTITVVPGSWGTGVSFTYQWFLDGVMIRGATSDKYLLTYADVGKVLSAKVSGSKSSVDFTDREVNSTSAITEQPQGGLSQGSLFQSSTSFKVVEEGRVYDSVTRAYVTREVNNYDVLLTHPTTVLCEQSDSYYSNTCSFKVQATWGGLFESYESFIETVRLVRISDRSQLDTDSIYLTTYSTTDSLEFSFNVSSLSDNNSLNRYQLEISDAGTNQTLTANGAASIQVIKSPNNKGPSLQFSASDSAIKASSSSFVYKGGTSSAPTWKLWQYAYPTRVLVMQGCAITPIFIAPQSLTDGSLDDYTTKSAADAVLSVYGGNGTLREKVSINGSRGDWSSIAAGNKVTLKVCNLNMQKGKTENLRVQLDLRYDAYNLESTVSTSFNVEMVGNMVFTKINCYQGEAGQVINAYKPVCPEGWTKTKAKIKGGKVVMTTLNCLAGRDLKVIRAPEAKCPEGYEVTDLAVKNGKLVPWTISCRKGFTRTTVRAVFPSCPAGYTRTF